MSISHVGHSDIARFAEERVNLKREDATELRRQANLLRDKLEGYLADHPDFALRKILLSGSLAKGTALKSISDIDVGCYVSSPSAPESLPDLLSFLAGKLRKAFPNFRAEQVKPKTYSVGVTFMTTGNEVDIVPIIYEGDPQWRGNLISQDTGEPLMTSVPMHLEFIRKRKTQHDRHFAQVIRLLKFWAKLRKNENEDFRLKSFIIELVVAYLADRGMALNDYPEALQRVFTFIATDEFASTIAFNDYYAVSRCKGDGEPMKIWDPVNCANNIAKLYTVRNRDLIVEAALDAGDAIDAALRAPTKGDTLRYWRKVFGPTFDV